MHINSQTNFFLQMRKKYDLIEKYLTSIIAEYDNLIKLSTDANFDTEYLRDFLDDYNNKKIEIANLKKQINDQLLACCDHEFVKDTIDYGLDNTLNIEYCVKCECNKEI